MLTTSSRIWTRVAVSTSYDDDRYTTSTTYQNKELKLWNQKYEQTEL